MILRSLATGLAKAFRHYSWCVSLARLSEPMISSRTNTPAWLQYGM